VLQKHELTIIVKDPRGLAVSNAEIKIYSNGEFVILKTTDKRGMLVLLDMPEGLYEARVCNLGITTSIYCPLDSSIIKQIKVPLSIYTLSLIVSIIVFASIIKFYLHNKK